MLNTHYFISCFKCKIKTNTNVIITFAGFRSIQNKLCHSWGHRDYVAEISLCSLERHAFFAYVPMTKIPIKSLAIECNANIQHNVWSSVCHDMVVLLLIINRPRTVFLIWQYLDKLKVKQAYISLYLFVNLVCVKMPVKHMVCHWYDKSNIMKAICRY